MEREHIYGLTEKNILDNGKIMQCMDMEYINGKMEENIKEIIIWIKNKDTENTLGLMVKYMKECGKMESSMDKGNYTILKR